MRTRFAPAPTGYLHLGHVVNAIFVWRLARANHAEVLLRIEDHDADRSRPEFEKALLDDLDWLGFAPDLYPTEAFRAGRCESRQSDRLAIYERSAGQLMDAGLVYGCSCSRSELGGEPRYPGTCRNRGIPPGVGVTWRLRLDAGEERFDDLLLGQQAQEPDVQCGDVAIRDRRGNWTYQFAVSVDDLEQGIDLVIRGADLLESTGRQIRIARLLGRRSSPRFAHHPLVMKSADQKLSKSDGDTGVRDLRAAGWSAADVIRAAVATVSLEPA